MKTPSYEELHRRIRETMPVRSMNCDVAALMDAVSKVMADVLQELLQEIPHPKEPFLP